MINNVIKLLFYKQALKIKNWSISNSLYYYNININCCADEVFHSFGCRYDLERLGCVPTEDHTKADLLIISGAIPKKLHSAIVSKYNEIPHPKFVMAIGSCSCGGGAFNKNISYTGVDGLDQLIPVDVFVPGCPPRPDAFMEGLMLLAESVGKEQRPLSWVIGEQGVIRPEKITVKDRRVEQRKEMVRFRSPDEV